MCGENGKKQTFAANLSGSVIGVGPVAYGEQVILDGKGNVSGNGTFSLDGAIYIVPITGTYTENADCTGSAQITPQGLSALNLILSWSTPERKSCWSRLTQAPSSPETCSSSALG